MYAQLLNICFFRSLNLSRLRIQHFCQILDLVSVSGQGWLQVVNLTGEHRVDQFGGDQAPLLNERVSIHAPREGRDATWLKLLLVHALACHIREPWDFRRNSLQPTT